MNIEHTAHNLTAAVHDCCDTFFFHSNSHVPTTARPRILPSTASLTEKLTILGNSASKILLQHTVEYTHKNARLYQPVHVVTRALDVCLPQLYTTRTTTKLFDDSREDTDNAPETNISRGSYCFRTISVIVGGMNLRSTHAVAAKAYICLPLSFTKRCTPAIYVNDDDDDDDDDFCRLESTAPTPAALPPLPASPKSASPSPLFLFAEGFTAAFDGEFRGSRRLWVW